MDDNFSPPPQITGGASGNTGGSTGGELYDLPPVSDPLVPEVVHGVPIGELYGLLPRLRQSAEDVTGGGGTDKVRAAIEDHPELALGLFQVLHEAGLMLDIDQPQPQQTAGSFDEEAGHKYLPLPTLSAPPPLPPGYHSWIQQRGTGVSTDFSTAMSQHQQAMAAAQVGGATGGIQLPSGVIMRQTQNPAVKLEVKREKGLNPQQPAW